MSEEESEPEAKKALLRMAKAYKAGKGVRLTNEELWFLDKTFLGEIWAGLLFDDEESRKRQISDPTQSA